MKSAGLTQPVIAPIIKDSDEKCERGLRADWSERGFWEHLREAVSDYHIFHAEATSYVNTPIPTFS